MDMRSTLFNLLSGNSSMPIGGPFKNFTDIMSRFNDYRRSFQGDPFQQVDELRNSGRLDDNTYRKLAEIASPIYNMLRGR